MIVNNYEHVHQTYRPIVMCRYRVIIFILQTIFLVGGGEGGVMQTIYIKCIKCTPCAYLYLLGCLVGTGTITHFVHYQWSVSERYGILFRHLCIELTPYQRAWGDFLMCRYNVLPYNVPKIVAYLDIWSKRNFSKFLESHSVWFINVEMELLFWCGMAL